MIDFRKKINKKMSNKESMKMMRVRLEEERFFWIDEYWMSL